MSVLQRQIQLVHSPHRFPPLYARDVRAQWAALAHFFSHCTDARPIPREATLALHVDGEATRLYTTAIGRARKLFGRPADISREERDVAYTWYIRPSGFRKALDYLAEGEPWHYRGVPTVALTFITFFRLRHPSTGKVLRGQDPPPKAYAGEPATMLYAAVGPEGHAWADLRFPFTRVNAAFIDFLGSLARELPFRLPLPSLRHAIPTASGERYRYQRLATNELARIKKRLVDGAA